MKIKCLFLAVFFAASVSAIFAQTQMPSFEKYAAKVETIKNVKVNLKSHKYANNYRTNLRNAAKEGVNFAGHFIVANWGCGTNCSETAIIDARNGKVFFPDELAGAVFGFCDLPDDAEPIVFKADSRLFVLNGFKSGDLESKKSSCGIYYLEWTGTNFKQVAFDKKNRPEMP